MENPKTITPWIRLGCAVEPRQELGRDFGSDQKFAHTIRDFYAEAPLINFPVFQEGAEVFRGVGEKSDSAALHGGTLR